MSRVYFQAPSGTAELWGGEYEHLRSIASVPGLAAFGLDDSAAFADDRCAEILALHPEPVPGQHGANYLHEQLRKAQDEHARNTAAFARGKVDGIPPIAVHTTYNEQQRMVSYLKTALNVSGLELVVAGVPVHTGDLVLNTALTAGSDVIRLAAKIRGWAASHLWVDGPHRQWLADLIITGVDDGILRERFYGGPDLEGNRRLVEVGWLSVAEFLSSRDDEPVVLAHSSEDSFPRWEMAGSPTMPVPDDWRPQYWSEQEWAEAEPEYREERRQEAHRQLFDELPTEVAWEKCLTWMRKHQPWLQMTPRNLASQGFALGLTVFDLFAIDRDERFRTAAGRHDRKQEEQA